METFKSINVWSLMNAIASHREFSNSPEAMEVQELFEVIQKTRSASFGNEFSFRVDDTGAWTFTVTNCFDDSNSCSAIFMIHPDGSFTVDMTRNGFRVVAELWKNGRILMKRYRTVGNGITETNEVTL